MPLPPASRQSGSCLAFQPQFTSCSLLGFYVLATMVPFLSQSDCAGLWHNRGFPGDSVGKESACNAGDQLQRGRPGFHPWVRKIPWRNKQRHTLVLLPRKSHGQRSTAGYSPRGRKESDMTERLHFTHSLERPDTDETLAYQ